MMIEGASKAYVRTYLGNVFLFYFVLEALFVLSGGTGIGLMPPLTDAILE
jgi:hypothetical protein